MGSSWPSEYFSHPGILLRDHLKNVGEASAHYLKMAGVTNQHLLMTAQIIGVCHDFGKYNRFFQRYLLDTKRKSKLSTHAATSALFTAWLIERVLPSDYQYLLPIAFTCVFQHHGHLKSPRTILEKLPRLKNTIGKQINSISLDSERITSELASLGIDDSIEFIRDYSSTVDKIEKELTQLRYWLQEKRGTTDSWSIYFQTLLLFSALIDADKKDAAGVLQIRRAALPVNLVDRFRKKAFKDAEKIVMNNIRNKLYQEAMSKINTLLQGTSMPHIMSITAPTGCGKTLVGLAAALKLRHHLVTTQSQAPPRIIYCLPYINIIEQTHRVFQDAAEVAGLTTTPPLLLKHHHLAIPTAKNEETVHHQLLLQESWDSEIIVTTFVQLLYTLIGYRNNFLKKYHNLYNSIIILDEVQALPIDYWFLVRQLFNNFARQANSYIIFMTATQPLIFPPNTIEELIPHSAAHFRKLDRTLLRYLPDVGQTPEKLAQFALEKFTTTNNSSLLIVVNTINTSVQVYGAIKEILSQKYEIECLVADNRAEHRSSSNKPVLAYLSTNIIPKERYQRIEYLRKLLAERQRVIVVATQVVEAGVDLDFDIVIRDIGPFDAINQVAGRCNRSAIKEKGQVYVVRMLSDRGNLYANYIYRNMHIRIAEKLLRQFSPLSESEFPTLLSKYMDCIQEYEGEIPDASQNILDAIHTLQFKNFEEFKLVDEKPLELHIPVFIELDTNATNTKKNFIDALERFKETERDKIFEQRAQLKRHLAAVSAYIVEVREHDHPPLEELAPRYGIRYVGKERSNEYYDRETGYRRETVHATIW